MSLSNPNHHSDSPRETELSGDSTDGVDFISSLPDEILHDILSNIPTKYAIRTSILSKRWKRVWHEIPSPSISIDYDEKDRVDSINKTLSSYPALKFKSFDVRISYDVTLAEKNLVYSWIELAMSRNTENLSLILECYHSFPDFFYINSSIKQLSLTFNCGLYTDLTPKCTVSWTSLRNLLFDNIIIPDKSIANILSGCPMLETLILSRCAHIHHLDLSRSVNLTRLEIIGKGHILGPEEIVAPHIHYLSVTNVRMPPTLVDVSSLTEAQFNLNYSRRRIKDDDLLQDLVLKLLAKLQNVEKLTIGRLALQILSFAEIRDVPFQQLKIKSLTIETTPVLAVIPGIVRLLQTSPGLKKITIHTTKGNIITDKDLERYIDGRWSGFCPATKQTSSSSFNSIAEEEKLEHVASFMEHVLWNTETLETMVILRLGGYLNETEYQTLLSKAPCNKNFKMIQ